MYPSRCVLPWISQCTVQHVKILSSRELVVFHTLRRRNLQAKSRSQRWRTVHCGKSMHGFMGQMRCFCVVCLSYFKKFISFNDNLTILFWFRDMRMTEFWKLVNCLAFCKFMHAFWCTVKITTVTAASTRLSLMYKKSPVFVCGSQPGLLKREHWLLEWNVLPGRSQDPIPSSHTQILFCYLS